MKHINLLSSKRILIVEVELACAIGINGSIVLRKFHEWIEKNKEDENKYCYQNGLWWSYSTYEKYVEKSFPFWSSSSLKDTILELEDFGLLISNNKLNDHITIKTKWYTIDYEMFDFFMDLWNEQKITYNTHKSSDYRQFIKEWKQLLNTHNEQDKAFCEQCQLPRSTKEVAPLKRASSSHLYTSKEIQQKETKEIVSKDTIGNAQALMPEPLFPLAVNPVVSTTNENVDTPRIENNEPPAPVTPTSGSKSQKKAKEEKPKRVITSAVKRNQNLASAEFTAACIEIANVDSQINFGVYRKLGFAVENAGYTIQDLQNFKQWWYEVAKHRKAPDIWDIREDIKQSKDYFASQTSSEPFATSETVVGIWTKPNWNELED